MDEKYLDSYLATALRVAKEAGMVAREAMKHEKVVQTKSSTADLVTETDKKLEQLIVKELRETYPSHKFIGEESAADSGQTPPLTDTPTWIIDPIDGTTNFVHGFPFSAVSIGLTVEKTPVVGVVYNFMTDQLFSARKGGGATMNGHPIHVSKCTDLMKAMLLTDNGSSKQQMLVSTKYKVNYELGKEPNPVPEFRCIGSAAIAMCLVANGSVDGYYENDLYCWDIAAGVVIAREAGAVCLFPTGEPLDLMARGVLCAANNELATKLAQYTKELAFPTVS